LPTFLYLTCGLGPYGDTTLKKSAPCVIPHALRDFNISVVVSDGKGGVEIYTQPSV